ncbi:hypothetical protein AWN90_04375 [Nocardia terpenica]|uniref:Uncharacterized protein n=1 Tax=Nocardia terpenica TaxID=455432 RepID=A0A164IY42_9NOCA|nr:hypothetical protein AWN90_04375 [Nocardia terpenica]
MTQSNQHSAIAPTYLNEAPAVSDLGMGIELADESKSSSLAGQTRSSDLRPRLGITIAYHVIDS